jgi:hypothetical protein
MHPKKVIPEKPNFLGLGHFSIQEISFSGITFLGALFHQDKFTFLISTQKDGLFGTPLFSPERKTLDELQRAETHFFAHVVFLNIILLGIRLCFCSVIFI